VSVEVVSFMTFGLAEGVTHLFVLDERRIRRR
jgi:hypothetical protein